MNTLLAFGLGYLVGSIPTAYLVVRRKSGLDIRSVGSGNVGAYNALEVTGSKRTGVVVMLLDACKGFLASFAAWMLFPSDFSVQAVVMIGAVVGHNYPVWLRFKGGRGLAVSLGAFFAVGQFMGVAWCSLWFVSYKLTNDILRANVFATVLSAVAVWTVPSAAVQFFMIRPVSTTEYAILGTILDGLFLISHAEVVRGFFARGSSEQTSP